MGVRLDLVVAIFDPVAGDVDVERAERDRLGRVGELGAPQRGPDPGDEDRHLERLGDVVVCAGLEADDDVDRVAAGGQHHHRDGRLGADRPAYLEPVPFGQHHVEDDEIGPIVAEAQQRLVTVGRRVDGEAGIDEPELRDVADGWVVLDEKNPCVHVSEYGRDGRGLVALRVISWVPRTRRCEVGQIVPSSMAS